MRRVDVSLKPIGQPNAFVRHITGAANANNVSFDINLDAVSNSIF